MKQLLTIALLLVCLVASAQDSLEAYAGPIPTPFEEVALGTKPTAIVHTPKEFLRHIPKGHTQVIIFDEETWVITTNSNRYRLWSTDDEWGWMSRRQLRRTLRRELQHRR